MKTQTRDLMCVPDVSNGVISVFANHHEADLAVKAMQQSGFDMRQLSIIGKDYRTEECVLGYYNLGERTKLWGKQGVFWGGLWGMLWGSGLFIIPGFGPIIVAGAFISTLLGAIEGAAVVGSFSVIAAALFSFGIPRDSIIKYESELKAGRYLLMAHGTTDEIKRASQIIKNRSNPITALFQSTRAQKKLESYFLDKTH